jgi:CRP-like cAMP-binding protein
MPISDSTYRNKLLEALSPKDMGSIAPHLELVKLALRQVVEVPNQPIKSAYFIERGFISVVANGTSDMSVEVGLIGREGVTGLAVLMGDDRSPHPSYVQQEGSGYRIGTKTLRGLMQGSATLHGLLLNFAHIFMVQSGQTALANGRANIEQRLARWLLMAQDRNDGDEIALTHEFLSVMLGVRRASVTNAIQALEKRKLISRKRAHIVVADRKGLERASGNTYGVPEAMYRRLIG